MDNVIAIIFTKQLYTQRIEYGMDINLGEVDI